MNKTPRKILERNKKYYLNNKKRIFQNAEIRREKERNAIKAKRKCLHCGNIVPFEYSLHRETCSDVCKKERKRVTEHIRFKNTDKETARLKNSKYAYGEYAEPHRLLIELENLIRKELQNENKTNS